MLIFKVHVNSGLRSSMINSGSKISSTAAGRSKFKLACQMQACCWAFWALRGCVRIVSASPWLLIKQSTCAWVSSAIKTRRNLVMWKAVEKQGKGIEPKIIFISYFNSNSTYSLWELAGFSMAGSASTLEMFLDLLPIGSSQSWQKNWSHSVYNILGTGKSSIFPGGWSFILLESDEYSAKCVFIKMKIWLMARKILNIWPCHMVFPIP